MPMAPFYTKFRDLAFEEMRSITLLEKQHGLPAGTYGFLESYCDEPGCDCRCVFLNVVTPDQKEGKDFLATINYGWEDLGYYTRWLRGDKLIAAEMKGPSLASAMVRQSKLAPALLDLFKSTVLVDKAYVERLKRHYRMFRDAIEQAPAATSKGKTAPPSDPGRNAPCGSGKKFKKCCGKDMPDQARSSDQKPMDEGRLRDRLKDLRSPLKADRPPSDFLADLLLDFPAPWETLARLAAYDGEEKSRKDAYTLLYIALQDPSVPASVKDPAARYAAPILRSAMKDPGVDDERKLYVGPLLAACGIDMPDREYAACFRDFKGITEREGAARMNEMSPTAENIERLLTQSDLIRHERPARPSAKDFKIAFGLGARLTELNPEAGGAFMAVAAAIAIEHDKVPLDVQAALAVASDTRNPSAAWRLSDLAAWPGVGACGTMAGELADEMRKTGIVPEIHSHKPFSHGMASFGDGAGSRTLSLFFRTPDGRMDALGFLLNDEVGVKDVWCSYDNGAEVEEQFRTRKGIFYAPVTLALGRELVEDALAIHERRNSPPPGRLLLYRPYLGGEPLRPRTRRPNLGAYALELLVRSPDLAAGSEALVKEDAFEELWCANGEAYAFVRGNLKGGKGRIGQELVDRFVREVAAGERDRLLSRMAVALETAAWAGRAGEPGIRLAARTWIVLSENIVPFHDVPYVRALSRRSIEAIRINLDMGFRNQRKANEAAMP